MRFAWSWLAGRSPIVIARRSTLRQWERNGFELGRDHERGLQRERVVILNGLVERLDEVAERLESH